MKKTHVLFLLLIIWSNVAFAQEESRFRVGLQYNTGITFFQRTFHHNGSNELDQTLNTYLPFQRTELQFGPAFSLQYKPEKYNFLLGVGYRQLRYNRYPYPHSLRSSLAQNIHSLQLSFTQRLPINDKLSHSLRFGAGCHLSRPALAGFPLRTPEQLPLTVSVLHKRASPFCDLSYGIERVGSKGNRWLLEANISLELIPRFTESILDANGAQTDYRSTDYRRHFAGFGITRFFDGKKRSIYKAIE